MVEPFSDKNNGAYVVAVVVVSTVSLDNSQISSK